jgi:copper chaperone
MKTLIKVDNLKCGGCAHTIEKNLLEIENIQNVIVKPDEGEVIIEHNGLKEMYEAKEKLSQLGYPEEGTTKGLDAMTKNLRSYVSCAVGKLDNLKGDKDHVSD